MFAVTCARAPVKEAVLTMKHDKCHPCGAAMGKHPLRAGGAVQRPGELPTELLSPVFADAASPVSRLYCWRGGMVVPDRDTRQFY